jgi:phage tail sheath protein FI
MPSAVNHPGVYTREVPSGVRTISGVATSITAFVGRTARGPVNVATVVNGFADFERIFGGLWKDSALPFGVRDFFVSGGAQAIIVRLYHADPGDAKGVPATRQVLDVGALKFVAANEGRWGLRLRVAVDVDNLSEDVATALGVAKVDLFNVTITDTGPGDHVEQHANLTVKDSSRRVDKVLAGSSDLIRYSGTPDAQVTIAPGRDPIGTKEKMLADAVKSVSDKEIADPAADVTTDKAAVSTAQELLDDALSKASDAISDGTPLALLDFIPQNGETDKTGLYALEHSDLFNLLVIPPYRPVTDTIDVDPALIAAAAAYCEKRRAMLIIDAPKDWTSASVARSKFNDASNDAVGTRSRNAALYFPRLVQSNPLRRNLPEVFAASGAVAGTFARTDATRGVWKAPAGPDANLMGVLSLSIAMTDGENGELNRLGINCLRSFAGGQVIWGGRTLRGSDQLADEYRYVSVCRTALFIEESLFRGLKWVVLEANDELLWAQIRLDVGAFMHDLFRRGAFQGTSPSDAYFVKCDKETTIQTDIDLGIVNILIGFAPLKPGEFVVVKLQQVARQMEIEPLPIAPGGPSRAHQPEGPIPRSQFEGSERRPRLRRRTR